MIIFDDTSCSFNLQITLKLFTNKINRLKKDEITLIYMNFILFLILIRRSIHLYINIFIILKNKSKIGNNF